MLYYQLCLVLEIFTFVSSAISPAAIVPADSREDLDSLYYTPAPDITNALRQHLIIPQLLRFGPEYELDVTYGVNSTVKFGNKFTAAQLEKKPTFIRWPCRQDAFHTLIVLGLDVPTQKLPSDREFRHWIVVNIPANNVSKGETLIPYEGPGFSYENGLHRLVFMVYEQPWRHKIHFSEVVWKDSPVRPKFKSEKFAEKYDIGDPVAVNFLLCETNWPLPTPKPAFPNE